MNKKILITCTVFAISLIITAYFISSQFSASQDSDLPIVNKDFAGISLHALSAEEAQLVNQSGAEWIRIDVFDNFGPAVINAKAFNLKVLGILDSWTMNNQTVFTLDEWCNNITYYISEYADYVDAWEIWNEPANPAPNWTLLNLSIHQQPDVIIQQNMTEIVDFYYSMAQTAYPIIRQYDPTAKIVLFGGLNLWSGGDPHLALDREFARQLSTKNIQQYGDAFSVHAYPWSQEVEPSIWQRYNNSLTTYREFYPTLEVWLTETGHPANFDGESGQAQYLTECLNYFKGDVTHVFWYSLIDNLDEENDFGLLDSNRLPRLAYYELQKASMD